MVGGRYEEVNGERKKTRKCLKFWLTFFAIATLALIGVVIWLVVAAKNGQSPYGYSAASSNGLVAASGHTIPEICTLPAAPGPCRARIERYFYDATMGACTKFIYGGCSGNGNNFETLNDCMMTCTPKFVEKPDYCMLEKDPGPCYTASPRYAYDSKLDECVEFTFGGCGGNRNNFESMEECEKHCKDPSRIKDPTSGNSNDTSVCLLPHKTGNCRGYIQRWGFDPNSGKCVQFVYGGCGGNGNNFETLEACEQRCQAYMAAPIPFNQSPVMNPICKLPQDSGPCRGSIRRWAYDVSRGSCVEFIYGGCQGNSNNFETREACETKCPASSPRSVITPTLFSGISLNPICKLPQDKGPCRAGIPRWAFDVSKGQCVQFIYGGCRGNENNFETKQQCEAACGESAGFLGSEIIDTSLCHLPLETGNCRGFFERWGFDPSIGQCVQFVYGGCGGNLNNFETKEACEQRCRAAIPMPLNNNDNLNNLDPVCKLAKDPGPCSGSVNRWAFELQKGKCIEFIYGGCQGNDNNFETREACEAKCSLSNISVIQPISILAQKTSSNVQEIPICQLPHERGGCMAYIPRWGFDASSGKCVQFIYGGCDGNANNFETQEDCEKKCKAFIPMPLPATNDKSIDPICKLSKEVGPCRGSNKRWAFDFSKGICEEFIYGGCRGNANNFESKEDCEARCGRGFYGNIEDQPVDSSVCNLPHEQGNCMALIKRWAYDPNSGKCIQFFYGGCGGNGNNFKTKEACEQTCLSSSFTQTSTSNNGALDPVCRLPQDTGPCRASMKRWSYDVSKGSCVEFIYGGCRGNDNNFETREACEAKCGGSPKSGGSEGSSGQTVDISICHLPLERGNCFQYTQRWGYDPATGTCAQFVYGGCGGNKNNFETQEACEQSCLISTVKGPYSSSSTSVTIPMSLPLPENGNLDQICSLPSVVGPCRASYRRWTYDASKGGCVEFIYGGCGGNANNFESREGCEARCGRNGGSETVSVPKLPIIEDDNDVCFMPHEKGDCYGFHERWGFEPKIGQCVMFVYSGCGGNGNNFESKEACRLRCIPGIPQTPKNDGSLDPICILPKDTGPCRGSLRRWAYDTSINACVEFIYGGCRGNENNFESREACEARCGNEGGYGSRNEIVNTSVCHLPQEIGKCLAYVPRWAFDPATGRCVQFIYGGCGGNGNNFKTKEDCEERCRAAIPSAKPADENDALDPICRLPQEVGPCQALIPRWAYDTSQGRCIEFSYGGCHGNANNFNSKEACEAKCGAPSGAHSLEDSSVPRTEGGSVDASICHLPLVSGSCTAFLQRWGFDPNTGQCVQFIYGGCGGNENSFETKEACEEHCLSAIPNSKPADANDVLDPVCKLPQETGPCKASVRRWSFDMFKGECVQFTYGGCRGNANNFESKEACEDKCAAGISIGSTNENGGNVDTSICHLPRESGNCYAFLQRWGFDGESGECVQFIYGGCGGNANNFETKEACEQRCLANIPNARPADKTDTLNPICRLPKEVGPCRSMLKRWYFDVANGKCTDFIYGGCRGNANNFETEGECEKICKMLGTYFQTSSNSHYGERPAESSSSAIDPVCKMPQDPGPCRGFQKRWSFDLSQGQCVEFIYGGCRGNANNFEFKEDCEERCGAYKDYFSTEEKVAIDLINTSVCHLPHERGNCRASLQRWGFDASSGRCVQFIYGGCGGNDNNFETRQDCEQKCLANIPTSRPADMNDAIDPDCRLPKEVGPCRARLRRWYYDASSDQCLEFYYGGCRGNANKFQSKEACEAKCKSASTYPSSPSVSVSEVVSSNISICHLPHERGNCEANIQRWGFYAPSGKCIQFVYGGCGGNANNFRTKAECEQICLANIPMAKPANANDALDPVCRLPQEVGPCRAYMKRWSYNLSKAECVEFNYGGCRGNANNFETKEACETKCGALESQNSGDSTVCNLPRERGDCYQFTHRWGYDSTSGKCIQFIYGGCGGNENNFETREECEQRCLSTSPNMGLSSGVRVMDPICRLLPDVGPCRASQPRWFYDTSSRKCEEFIYGGCRGNENNFATKEACEAKCGENSPGRYPQEPQESPNNDNNPDNIDTSICHLPFEKGMCMAHFQRWGFDPNSGRCVQFAYGGCGGNENNFGTKEACEQICLGAIPNARPADRNDALDPVCRLPQDVGPCKAMTKRWSYDLSLGSCIEFYYGGCRGNANNFETREACEATCTIPGAQPISNVDICKLPKEEGTCQGRNPRFYYDSASKQCLKFNYGGCRGNENNFITKAECEARCAEAA